MAVRDATPLSELTALFRTCRDELASFEPERYEVDACAELAEELAGLTKSCDVAAVRAAARAMAGGAHRERGYAGGPDWVAALSGSTSSAAREALQTVAAVETCLETRDALRSGTVSVPQAGEIVRAEREAPGSEHELLETAKTSTLSAVREHARSRRLVAVDREELRARQHAAREVRHWRDGQGMVCGSFKLEPVAGTSFVNRLERETDRRWRTSWRAGCAEPRDALAADAFLAMVGSDGAAEESSADGSLFGPAGSGVAATTQRRRRRRSVNADVVIVQSAEAVRHGHVHPGELCHVVGGGPVAPSEVEELIAAGAFVKAVLHDGTQVTHVAHHGRHLSAETRTALGLGAPPTFDGRRCSEAGCERRLGLETDHLDPVANGGATSLENLDDKCWVHHQEKTDRDRAAGLMEHGP
jgi:hypothetical protein